MPQGKKNLGILQFREFPFPRFIYSLRLPRLHRTVLRSASRRLSIKHSMLIFGAGSIKICFNMGGWVIKLFFFIKIPLVSSIFEEFPFPIFCLCCFLPSCLPIIKKFFIMGGWVKRWKYFGRKPVEHAANDPI